jgi:hypothetical protein
LRRESAFGSAYAGSLAGAGDRRQWDRDEVGDMIVIPDLIRDP